MEKADDLEPEFFRLRAKAVVALLESGKRRGELALLERDDFTVDKKFLNVNFPLLKKRSKIRPRRTHRFKLNNWAASFIIDYLDYIDAFAKGKPKYIFPVAKSVFGRNWLFDFSHPAHPKSIYRIIKALNKNDWVHLHREKRAVQIIRRAEENEGEASIKTVFEIKDALDLENETTAWRYIRRYGRKKVEISDLSI